MIHAGGAAKIQAAGGVRSLVFEPSMPLQLANGQSLSPLTIAFETYGALNVDRSNAVMVCHGLTGDQFAASPNPITGRPAWWPRVVGPGRPIDTNRFFVVCPNVLGGSMGSTGPSSLSSDGQPYGVRFPNITIADSVRAQSMLAEALGVESLFLVAGVGLGGMQALNWASAYPKRVFACATVASSARHSAQNLAFSELGRQAIMADPAWRGGAYLSHGVRPAKGLSVARIAAHISDISEAGLREKFERAQADDTLTFGLDASHMLESFRQQSTSYVDRFDANSFLYLSRAMDQFDLGADFGGNLANAFQGATTRHAVFSFSSDWRYPSEDSRTITRALIAAGAEAAHIEVETNAGHEAHLGEEPEFERALTGFIDSAAAARGLSLHYGAP